jgi:hypothetical protein
VSAVPWTVVSNSGKDGYFLFPPFQF